VRRKADTVLALEAAILSVLVEQAHAGNGSMHGFELARHVRDDEGGRELTARHSVQGAEPHGRRGLVDLDLGRR